MAKSCMLDQDTRYTDVHEPQETQEILRLSLRFVFAKGDIGLWNFDFCRKCFMLCLRFKTCETSQIRKILI